MTAEIKFDPDPPVRGQSLTITYTGTLPVTINLTWTPAGEPSTATIEDPEGVTITVPDNATNLLAEDDSGEAPYRDVPVTAS